MGTRYPASRQLRAAPADGNPGLRPLRRRAREWRHPREDRPLRQGTIGPSSSARSWRAGLLAGALALGALLATPLSAQRVVPWDTASLMRSVRVLAADSMEGRRAGSPGGARARRFLVQRFRALGLRPLGAGYEHAFPLPGDTSRGVNLLAVIAGTTRPERYIVLSAHYDHLGMVGGEVYNGADDNASGTAAVLALAAELCGRPLRHSVIVALFDGEEPGLLGARAFLAESSVATRDIALVVNLDMVGHSEPGVLWAAGSARYPLLRAPLVALQANAPVRLRLGHDRPGLPGQDDWTNDSDHGAFHAAGIPFVYFGVADHRDYHRPTDDPETLTPAFFGRAVATIAAALRSLDLVAR